MFDVRKIRTDRRILGWDQGTFEVETMARARRSKSVENSCISSKGKHTVSDGIFLHKKVRHG